MPKCPNCGSRNSSKNIFCGQCGHKLPEPNDYCPNCNLIFKKEEKFCTQCGRKLVNKIEYYKKILYYKVNHDFDNKMISILNQEIGSPFLSNKSKKEILDYIFSNNSVERIGNVVFNIEKEEERKLEEKIEKMKERRKRIPTKNYIDNKNKWQVCPKCNHKLAKTAKKCPYCNETLKNKVDDKKTKINPNHGHSDALTISKESSCSTPLSIQKKEQKTDNRNKICPKCGYANRDNLSSCWKCGLSLNK